MNKQPESSPESQPPPVLGTWRRVYFFVAAFFVFEVVAFYLFSRYYS